MIRLALCTLLVLPAACAAQADARARDPETLYRTSRYEEAIAAWRPLAESPANVAARRGMLRALAMTGQYEEAERLGRGWIAGQGSAALLVPLGDVLLARGRLAAAESLYARAVTAAPDSLRARTRLAESWWRRGERERALRAFDAFIDVYNARKGRLTSEELAAVAVACRYLGERDPQLFKDALRAFDAAIAADSADPEPRIALAELFLSKYAAPDAEKESHAARARAPGHPGALLAAARIAHFNGTDSSRVLVRRALSVNPNHAEARVFLASLYLDSEQDDSARVEAERALATDPSSVDALAVLAVGRLVRNDDRGFEEIARRAAAIDPRPASLFATAAEASARHRGYERAVTLARRSVALDSSLSQGQTALGLNLMRTGRIDEARRVLERAFAGDPYNVWVKNTLDLLDTYDEYDTLSTRRFHFMIDRKESALLGPYLAELMEDGYAKMAARYGYQAPVPVRLELFRSHADFSVRTVGLAGLGALGVSFGSTLAMDSPAARPVGEFNWGSTAWHELAHAFTLGATDHRVPRWFSEGLSVLEERRARSGWGAGVTLPFLAMYKAGGLVPPSRLNDGFVRPRHPREVIWSYYQASLVCEMIEQQWGAPATVQMLRGYRDGLSTEDVFRRVLKVEPKDLDVRFDEWMRRRFATPLAAIRVERAGDDGLARIAPPRGEPANDDLVAQLTRGTQLFDAAKYDEALPFLERASRLFPDLSGDESPRWMLARIHDRLGNPTRVAAELDTLLRQGEMPWEALLLLAKARDELGDRRGAAEALERAIWVSPYDPAVHQRLAELSDATGAHAVAVRERRAIVALDPVDRADALYQLALAHEKAGERTEARRTVLRALEEAPNFEEAQELLLRLRGGE